MEINKVLCVGAGLIGQGWATLFSWKGYRVALQDLDHEILERALAQVRWNFEFLAEKGLLKDESCDDCLGRIRVTTELAEAVGDVDYVQESVFESYGVKKEVFGLLDAEAPAGTILASSSSTLRMSIIQEATKRPDRCIVVHPWNPPHLMPLVEIIPGRETSPQTVEAAKQFMTKLGKVPLVQKKEVSGTIGNRLAAALWREAIDLVNEDVAELEDVDKAVSASLGLRWAIMGPHMSYHLGGGKGGIEYYLQHLGPAMESRWRTLAKWTRLSPSMKGKIIEGVRNWQSARGKSSEELSRWRDEKLVELLKILYREEV